jgi:hypothetical protein
MIFFLGEFVLTFVGTILNDLLGIRIPNAFWSRVSAQALIIRLPMEGSLAHDGTKPQRINLKVSAGPKLEPTPY